MLTTCGYNRELNQIAKFGNYTYKPTTAKEQSLSLGTCLRNKFSRAIWLSYLESLVQERARSHCKIWLSHIESRVQSNQNKNLPFIHAFVQSSQRRNSNAMTKIWAINFFLICISFYSQICVCIDNDNVIARATYVCIYLTLHIFQTKSNGKVTLHIFQTKSNCAVSIWEKFYFAFLLAWRAVVSVSSSL
jgi:hypothetical protein